MAKKEEQKLKAEFDLGLGGLFKGVGNLIDLISKLTEEGEVTRTGKIAGLPGKAKGVYGFTVRMGLGGLPRVEEFGNIRKTEAGPVVAEVREPIVDILDEGGSLLVIAELPGVEGEVHLEVKEDILTLSAEGKDRKYSKEVLLPSPVAANTMKSSLRNGILEIRLEKKEPAKPKKG